MTIPKEIWIVLLSVAVTYGFLQFQVHDLDFETEKQYRNLNDHGALIRELHGRVSYLEGQLAATQHCP